jgi:hypothetical protein
MQTMRNWRKVKGDEAGAVSEDPAIVAIEAGTANQSDLEETVESVTGTLVQEKAETAMTDGATILGIVIISVVGIVENETTGVAGPVEIGHAPVLATDGEQAIDRAAVVERGETVPVVAIGYVLQVLLLETPSSNHGS